ncbi:MAG: septal ring lytic transglycosylase RlpA family lipoprotein [Methylocystis sp.]|nr:MAG: septal ring lytic transglycosylase RlpA family lipoprotein [Methylocystis sp.]
MRSAVSREQNRLLNNFRPAADNLRKSLLLLSMASLAGCASTASSPRYASLTSGGSTVDSKYGVKASPRVVADGEEVPKGGGNYMVGKPYKIAGQTYYPSERPFAGSGTASWYGSDFHGRRTANGEIFDRESITAAHPTMPLPSYARVTNMKNLRSIIVRVNDRGPYHGGRVMDVSQRVAEALDFRSAGTAQVKVEWIGRANIAGDDDRKLLATLRDDGQPANIEGVDAPVMVAERERREPVRSAAVARQDIAPEPAARAVVNDAPPFAARPVEMEMTAYAQPERSDRPEPLSEPASAQEPTSAREGAGAIDSDPVATTSVSKTADRVKAFMAAPLPPVRPSSLSRNEGADAPAMRQALN